VTPVLSGAPVCKAEEAWTVVGEKCCYRMGEKVRMLRVRVVFLLFFPYACGAYDACGVCMQTAMYAIQLVMLEIGR
jgi:hypothetical protein